MSENNSSLTGSKRFQVNDILTSLNKGNAKDSFTSKGSSSPTRSPLILHPYGHLEVIDEFHGGMRASGI